MDLSLFTVQRCCVIASLPRQFVKLLQLVEDSMRSGGDSNSPEAEQDGFLLCHVLWAWETICSPPSVSSSRDVLSLLLQAASAFICGQALPSEQTNRAGPPTYQAAGSGLTQERDKVTRCADIWKLIMMNPAQCNLWLNDSWPDVIMLTPSVFDHAESCTKKPVTEWTSVWLHCFPRGCHQILTFGWWNVPNVVIKVNRAPVYFYHKVNWAWVRKRPPIKFPNFNSTHYRPVYILNGNGRL